MEPTRRGAVAAPRPGARPGPYNSFAAVPAAGETTEPAGIWDSTPGSPRDGPGPSGRLPARVQRPDIPRGGSEPLHIPFIVPPIAASLSGRSLLNSVPGHSVPDLETEAGGGPG